MGTRRMPNSSQTSYADGTRLHAEREAIFTQQHELETQLTALNNEMRAIDAYEPAKGKATPTRRLGTEPSRHIAPWLKTAGILAPRDILTADAGELLERWG